MTAGIVESIHFTKTPGTCEHGGDHSKYSIHWTEPGWNKEVFTYWCDHPICEAGVTRWRLLPSPPEVKLTKWIPSPPAAAVAYLLLAFPVDALPRMEARIGIVSQWQDPTFGNYGEDNEMKLFTERYFAESGPGVYPAPIVTVASDDSMIVS